MEEHYAVFHEELRLTLGGREWLPDDCESTAEVVRKRRRYLMYPLDRGKKTMRSEGAKRSHRKVVKGRG